MIFYRHPSENEPPRVLSEDEMNKLGARIVKAELMGNMVMFLKNYDNLLQFCMQCFSLKEQYEQWKCIF